MRLCAICVKRPADLVEEIDRRKYLVCSGCVTTEVEEPRHLSLHERVFVFLRQCPSVSVEAIGIALGTTEVHELGHISQVLSRMVRAGLARYTGLRNDRQYSLVSGASLAPKRVPNRVEMVGRKFGRLTVVAADKTVVTEDNRKEAYWRCRCECGGEKVARGCDLRGGSTKSCGCLIGRYPRKPAAPAKEAMCPAT